MMDILLAKPKLEKDWIDFSVGEPHCVRESLFEIMNPSMLTHPFLKEGELAEYPPPNGYDPLVRFLEDKYQAPVIITNGAKQALGASFYALQKSGKTKLGMRTPYWALIPPLAKAHGLSIAEKYDSYLAILPNNPDGFMWGYDYAKYLSDWHKDLGIPFIHDAAYYTPVYLPKDFNYGPLGDLQIFSISKMFGISGIRVGYVVCHNYSYYKDILEYMETMTVGVSTTSQHLCYTIFQELAKDENDFVDLARNHLNTNRNLCKKIPNDVLEVPDDIIRIPGMFGWFKVGPKCDFKKAKINTVDGKLFGDETMVRINLALPSEVLAEAVKRLCAL